jgi:Na+-transporting methylmalonyl-CoA/oxaloacetate decarboxylase gamma subunit
MAEGLTVIAAGIVVVLCIMASMFVFIELILKFDQILRARAERASAPEAVEPAGAADAEASEAGDEVIAAIGLALQKHFAARTGVRSAAASGGSGPTPWASSGRQRIMSERQRVTTRRS